MEMSVLRSKPCFPFASTSDFLPLSFRLIATQWWLRFKRGVCHAKQTYLKHDPLLIRFKRGFLLNRDPDVRETSLRPDYMGFRVPVAGINSAGRDARVVVTNRSVQRSFYMFYTILLCVTGPTPSAIPPYYCVRYSSSRENRFSSVVSKLFQHHLNTAANNTEREVRERHTLNISEACMRERLKPTMVQLSLPVKVKHLQYIS